MARLMMPIIDVLNVEKPRREVSLEALEALETADVVGEDDFTYTMRVTVAPESQQEVRKLLEKQLSREDFSVLTEILDETEWDCSFLVDCY